ncbi:hypothetical protein HUT07_10500 [Stenotrophomonas sp. NA06056]|nr:hypothetical protein HUT07_10500 [Stenotrophomonas sp. NA06056]
MATARPWTASAWRKAPTSERLRIAWAAVALVAAVVVPLSIAEIVQAHADRDATPQRWATTSSVRG